MFLLIIILYLTEGAVLANGTRIPPNSALVIDVRLLSINGSQ